LLKLFTVSKTHAARAAFLAGLGVLGVAVFAQNPTTMVPVVRGTRYMLGAGNNLEVAAGTRILEQGGNAIDAGVAAALAASITEMDHFGLGGEMPLIIKMKGQQAVVISGVGTAPALATREFFNSRKPEPWEEKATMPPIPANGILAATVPGVFDGLMLALEKYGTMSFAQVSAPALEYTRGFSTPEIFSKLTHLPHSFEWASCSFAGGSLPRCEIACAYAACCANSSSRISRLLRMRCSFMGMGGMQCSADRMVSPTSG